MKPKTYTILFVVAIAIFAGCNKPELKSLPVCPDCGETGCIYEQIDDACEGETDSDILKAIYFVCGQRRITDSVTIDLIKANYSLN